MFLEIKEANKVYQPLNKNRGDYYAKESFFYSILLLYIVCWRLCSGG